MEQLGDIALVEKLMPPPSLIQGMGKNGIFLACMALFRYRPFASADGRKTCRKRTQGRRNNYSARCIELHAGAGLFSPTVWKGPKLAISRLVDKLRGDRIGLIIFAGEIIRTAADYIGLCLCKDISELHKYRFYPGSGNGSGRSINMAMRSFSGQGQMGMDNKAIILITDGENHEADPVIVARSAAERGHQGLLHRSRDPGREAYPNGRTTENFSMTVREI